LSPPNYGITVYFIRILQVSKHFILTLQKTIIGVGIIVGLYLFGKTKPTFLKAILVGFILSYGLTFFNGTILIDISFFSFGILTLGFTVWSGLHKKWLNSVIGLFGFLSFLWGLLHYEHVNLLQFLMTIPIILFILTLFNLRKYKGEMSILTILAAYELTEFVNWTNQMIN